MVLKISSALRISLKQFEALWASKLNGILLYFLCVVFCNPLRQTASKNPSALGPRRKEETLNLSEVSRL